MSLISTGWFHLWGGQGGGEKKKSDANQHCCFDQPEAPAQITVHGGGAFPLAACNAGQARRPRCSPTAPRLLLTGCRELRGGFYYADSNALPVESALNDNLEEIPVA